MEVSVRKIALAFVFVISSFIAVHAQPTVQSSVDTRAIFVGQQIQLKVVANIPKEDFFVKWMELPDTLPHFELVAKSKIDSVFSSQKLTRLSQTFTFTSFDSGKWRLPSFEIYFNPSSGSQPYNLLTDTFTINVSYQPDSTTVLRDIKDIRPAGAFSPFQVVLIVILSLLAVGLLARLIYVVIVRSRKRQVVGHEKENPYQKAMIELDKLKGMDIENEAARKIYHTALKEILKTYLASIQGQFFISNTTREIVQLLLQKALPESLVAKTAEALRRSDGAQFARYSPSSEESEQDWNIVKQVIGLIEQQQNNKQRIGT